MKFQLLLLLLVSLASACQISQKAQMSGVLNNANSSLQTDGNTIVNKTPEKVKPKPVDVSKFMSVKINRTDVRGKFLLKIDVEYPQLKNVKTLPRGKFNRYVKKQVDEQILDFTKFLADKEKNIKSKVKNEYEINLSYRVDYFSNNFISVLMNWNGFSGYLNMDYFPSTINFDLRKGEVVKLKDLFEADSKYLEKISELSRNTLKKTCLSCPCKNGINAGDSLPAELIPKESAASQNSNSENTPPIDAWYIKGTEPEEENFSNWSIVDEGLKITFGEYQVGPGCIGIIDITIPFQDLKPILKSALYFN